MPHPPIGGETALACRVIPCLDVADGKVVKGVRFEDLQGFGSPAAAARRYCDDGANGAAGADEIVFLDIAASHERRGPALAWIERVAESVFIPLTVGGGVRTLDDARDLLAAGARPEDVAELYRLEADREWYDVWLLPASSARSR